MAVVPSPIYDPQVPFDLAGLDTARRISNDGPSNPGNDSAPQIAVNRYSPNKVVAVWTDHDNNLGNPPNYGVRGAWSNDGGLTWTSLAGLPGTRIDPASGNNPQPFSVVDHPTVTFDGKDNFYVLELQHSGSYASGQMILQPYSFSGTAPAAKAATVFPSWFQGGDATIFPYPDRQTAIFDAAVVADDNLPSFTDPTTGLVQTDIGANRVYIAQQVNLLPPSGYTGPWNPHTIEVLASLNSGASFGAPLTAGAGHFQNVEMDASPRITISQGRAPGTNSLTDAGVPGGQVTVVFDDFNSGRNSSPPQDIIWATPFTPSAGGLTSLGQKFVASTVVFGGPTTPYANSNGVTAAASPVGIGPGAVIASDNTLGSFHVNQGRLYVAYTDRYDSVRFPAKAGSNPTDNTDIFLRVSDNGGLTWTSLGKINDDDASLDGFSAAIDTPIYTTGRPQFLPSLAVDPVTGTLAVSYEDTRFDPSKARTVSSIQISSDGGRTFAPSVHADIDLKAYDQTTSLYQSVGPVPSNQSVGIGRDTTTGLGDRQGLAIYGGRLYDAFITNLNGGSNTDRRAEVHVSAMLYTTGPRVISSTMGQVGQQSFPGLDGKTYILNNPLKPDGTLVSPDGTPVVDGFVVTFDRPIDPTSFTRADVTVTYRDAFTSGSVPGIPVPITQDPIPLADGTTSFRPNGVLVPLTTKFLVKFAPQNNVGTYSYTVGPNIRDLYRNTLATNLYYADQSPANLPVLPPTGTGGNDSATNKATSTLLISGIPANQTILDLDVLVTLTHGNTRDLELVLIPPGGGAGITLVPSGTAGGVDLNFVDLTFDDQALRGIAASAPAAGGPQLITGHYQPTGLLRALNGTSPNGTWTLQIRDLTQGNTGKLVSWGLKVTTSNRSVDGKFTQPGTAVQTGSVMDQNGDGLGGQNPNTGGVNPAGSEFFGTAPGDVYAAPTPNPTQPQIFNGQNVNPPFSPTTLPLTISGPHIIRSYVPGAAKKTLDNLITDQVVTGFNVVFDRDMDPNTITLGNHIARLITPYGTFVPGQLLPDGSTLVLQIKSDPNADPTDPNSDPDTTHPRTYQVVFMKIPAGGTNPVPFPQNQSGTYSVVFTSDIQDKAGEPLDTNQNAGLDFLRGTPSAGTLPQLYHSQAAVPIGPTLANESIITVPDSFLIKNVVVGLNITYPQDSKLTATLISPDGFSVLLFSNVGNVGNGQNFTNTFLDDSASTPISNGGPPFFGRFNPQQPLSQFIDHFSSGTWRLRVDVAAGSPSGTIVNWSLQLDQPLSNSGLGELVADQATESFRIFTFDPTNPLAANTWTAIGPNGEGAKVQGGNAEVSGRVGAIAIDPSDPSGNTVYVSGATGGIWKTTNFLTTSAAGPTYLPLTDNATILGMSVSSIAIFPRNNDPNQSIIFATTGDSAALAETESLGSRATSRSIGFLRSMDGGATWTLLDSRDNTSQATRDHFFASIPGQTGLTSYKIIVDPKPAPNGQTLVYAALSDIDGNGNPLPGGTKGGIWKSADGGTTWLQMRAGQATDVTLDLNSTNKDSGNLDFLYAAFRGEGVFFSPNAAQVFNLMAGTTGDPLIRNSETAQPVPVNLGATPNAKAGLIVLAKPALTGQSLPDLIYQGWLYAAVDGSGLYMTKDFGQNWVQVQVRFAPGTIDLPTNDIRNTLTSVGGSALTLAVDPTNPNVVFIGNTSNGLIRVDSTTIHDAHAFYLSSSNNNGALRTTGGGALNVSTPTSGSYGTIPPSLDPITQSQINLIRDPSDPFAGDATIRVHNSALFVNDGSQITWTPFDDARTPDPFAGPTDPWSRPTRSIHQILTTLDPLTGKARLLVATNQGIYTAVSDAKGQIIGSIGSRATLATNQGDVRIVNGSRNGNLSIAQYNQGAAQPSQFAADLSVLQGFFYGATTTSGISQSDPNIINPGTGGYGNLSYNIDTINGASVDRGPAVGLGTQQTVLDPLGNPSGGTLYAFRNSFSLEVWDGRPVTDTFQVNAVGRTFGLYQTSNPGPTPDAQWPYNVGFNLVINPLSDQQMLISSNVGRVFATTTQGRIWSEIGNPNVLDNTNAQALAYGAPDPAPPGGGLGSLNNYIFAGTKGGKIFVTFTGGGGAGNSWTPLSTGLDGSPVQMIVTNPNRGSHEAYAVTERAVYHMLDSRVAGATWINITGTGSGNLFNVLKGQFNDPTLGTQQILRTLTSIQADWRYLIPNDFTNPSAGTHPMLYVGGEGGVFRSLDGGQNWSLFPDGAVTVTGASNSNGLLFSPAGEGGGLPNNQVTDLDLSLGFIDPTTGRAAAVSTVKDPVTGQTKQVAAPNLLMASTLGRGAFAIRLAPIVFTNSATNTTILTLSPTQPVPPGTSDSGFLNTDYVTNVTRPVIEGLSEQSAFGNTVTIDLYDVSTLSQAQIQSLLVGTETLTSLGIPSIGTGTTDSTGHFAVRVNAGVYNADGSTDGRKKILVQATNGSGTKGNLAPLGLLKFNDATSYSFILDTIAPVAPSAPDLTAASDSGLSSTDNITNITTGLAFSVTLSSGEPSTTHVYLVRDNTVVDEKFGTAAPGQIILTDPGPVGDGDHIYYSYEVDLAGNKGPNSGTLTIRVDTVAPSRPSAPILDPLNPAPNGSDSGIVGDNITNVKQPFLSGNAEPGGLIQVIDAAGNVLSDPIPAHFAQANGQYSVKVNLAGDGVYTLRTREQDVAGNLSPASVPIQITILSKIPTAPTLFLVTADDSGENNHDNITNVDQPRLIGAATPGLSIQLILDSGTIPGVAIGGVIAPTSGQQPIIVAADGSYLIRFPNKLADGTYVVHTRVSDVAGNSSQSAPLTLTILGGSIPNPNPAPTPTPDLILAPADDTGVKGDNITSVRRPHFIGTARFPDGTIAPNVPVDLIDAATGKILAGSTTTTTGTFNLSLPNDLSNGSIQVQARVRDVAGNPGTASNVVALQVVTVYGDVNNDGRADLNTFSRLNSTFTFSNAGIPNASLIKTDAPFLTQAGDVPFEGDFDGDGKMDYGFYRPGTSQWYLSQSRAGWILVPFGQANDLPVPADYDGDGRVDFATYRPTTGQWTIFQSGSGKLQTVAFGVPGLDQPVPADYDGVGHAQFAVYRPSTGQWLAALNPGRNAAFAPPTAAFPVYSVQWGLPNVDVPVASDYDGDGKIDVAVYRPTNGQWNLRLSNGTVGQITVGSPNVDIPVPGDYDGDGRSDFVVFRPSDATWRIIGTASAGRVISSGRAQDVPLGAPLQPYRIQNATVQTRGFAGSSASDFSTTEAGPDLGRTASSFASGSSSPAKSSAISAPVTPPGASGRRARQAEKIAAHKAKVAAHKAKVDAKHHDAALAKLGTFKIVRRPV